MPYFTESQLQINLVKWFRLKYPEHVMYAIPNGGKRSVITAAIMKAEGVLPGVADLFLMQPNKDYHGLYIEVKTEKGKQSPYQKEFERKAKQKGYDYQVCRNFDEFQEIITKYLSIL